MKEHKKKQYNYHRINKKKKFPQKRKVTKMQKF